MSTVCGQRGPTQGHMIFVAEWVSLGSLEYELEALALSFPDLV